MPYKERGRFQAVDGLIRKDDKGQWRKWAPAGLPKADFQRWMGDRVYLNTHYDERGEIDTEVCEYDRQRRRWFVPSCYKEDGLHAQFNRPGLLGNWLPAKYRK